MRTLVLLNLIIHVSACGSNVEKLDSSEQDKKYLWNMSQWDVWKPDDDNKSMNEWMAMYKSLTRQMDNWDEFDMSKDPGFPPEWHEYGDGIGGVPPPPWAYIPNAYGRPNLCFLFPAMGKCNQKLVRWAFNPASLRCHQFWYSGCGANENNFKTKASCERTCMSVPSSPCEAEGNLDFVSMVSAHYPSDEVSTIKLKNITSDISKNIYV